MSTQLNDKILPIIREAGKIILSARGMYDESKVNCKEGAANFVTEYDVQVQEFLIGAIKNAFVDAVFIAEEKENDPSLIYQEHCFIIDPIDGTANFVFGRIVDPSTINGVEVTYPWQWKTIIAICIAIVFLGFVVSLPYGKIFKKKKDKVEETV